MHRFGSVRSLVLICLCRTEASTSSQQRSRGGRGQKVCLWPPSGFLFSRAKTEGERRVVSYLRGVVVLTLCFQLVVLVLVCVVVCRVIWVLLHHSLSLSLPPADRPSSRLTESSCPELRSVHLPTGGAGGAPLIMAEGRRRNRGGGHYRSVISL